MCRNRFGVLIVAHQTCCEGGLKAHLRVADCNNRFPPPLALLFDQHYLAKRVVKGQDGRRNIREDLIRTLRVCRELTDEGTLVSCRQYCKASCWTNSVLSSRRSVWWCRPFLASLVHPHEV